MLIFNPKLRYTADDCLKSAIFDSIRTPQLEEPAISQVDYIIDYEGAINYPGNKPLEATLTQSDYKRILMNELKNQINETE